jgi:DNA repair protein SbcC/Rad50
MIPHLDSISITDFRSISGTVTVPLDAPVVLVHGANGAGKTSVLSALELALTGDIPAMKRSEPNYREHLIRRGAELSRIVLSASGLSSSQQMPHETIVTEKEIEGADLLEADDARFFSERCFLPQASLSRLLEIYQYASAREDSPLTRFVKDLLGLDSLEALINGLHAAGDIRNTRRLVPEYGDTERRLDAIKAQLARSRAKLTEATDEAAHMQAAIRKTLVDLSLLPLIADDAELPASIEDLLAYEDEERRLVATISLRREAASIRQRAAPLSARADALDQASAEDDARTTRAARESWASGDGKTLEALLDELRGVFPDLPSIASTDPRVAHETASSRVEAELARCTRALADDDAAIAQLEQLRQTIDQNRARVLVIDEELGRVVGDAESLSRALADIVPHIHEETCPVCGRDFREVSPDPLVQHVSGRITELTEQAGRIQGLGRARIEATTNLSAAEGQQEIALATTLSDDARAALKARISMLSEATQRLGALADAVEVGAKVLRGEAEAQQRLAEMRNRDHLIVELRSAVADLYKAAGLPPSDPTEALEDAIGRLEDHTAGAEANLSQRVERRREALEQYRTLIQTRHEITQLRHAISSEDASHKRYAAAYAAAESRRQAAKTLVRAADDTRGAIVRQVFNSSLNRVWRDLFVRLAPAEPYVPAFRVPTTASGPVNAQLETVHREGGSGGAPGAMLSAGNLNTAALTLFLALHLSVKPELPWLILDDPVQSMDEVHISQFAALLRTLAREHHRQIVMAVHERPLFDYLALELSPAFSGDKLITVELTAYQDRPSVAEPTFFHWEPDQAVAA